MLLTCNAEVIIQLLKDKDMVNFLITLGEPMIMVNLVLGLFKVKLFQPK